MERRPTRILAAGFLLSAVLLVLHARVYWGYTVDDAFISMRYAKNLADGNGLVYNPGERVEGYSNLAWTLMLAGLHKISPEPLELAKATGVLLGVLALPFILLLVVEATGSASAAALVALLIAANQFVAVWLVAGLEGPLFLFALAAFALAASQDRKVLFVLAGALVCLCRPEGAALVGAIAVWRTVWDSPQPESRLGSQPAGLPEGQPDGVTRKLRVWLFLPLLATAAQLAFRLSYYGQWVPNTALIKTGGGWPQYQQGLQYLVAMFDDSSFRLGFPLLCVAALVLRKNRAGMAALVLSATYLVFLVYSGGDYFAHYRLVVPIFPLMTAVLVSTMVEVSRRLSLRPAVTVLVVGMVAVALVAGPQLKGGPSRVRLWKEQAMMDGFLHPAGLWLRDHSPPGTTIALTVAGAIPYYSGLRTIDRFGLTDAEIARADLRWEDRHYGIAKYDTESVLRRKPEWIMLNMDEATILRFSRDQVIAQAYVPADRDLLSKPRFYEEYRLVPAWLGTKLLYQELALFARKGSAVDPGGP